MDKAIKNLWRQTMSVKVLKVVLKCVTRSAQYAERTEICNKDKVSKTLLGHSHSYQLLPLNLNFDLLLSFH